MTAVLPRSTRSRRVPPPARRASPCPRGRRRPARWASCPPSLAGASAHGRPAGRPGLHDYHTGAHTRAARAARTAGLSLAALGAVATAGGLATTACSATDATPPATGETAVSPQLASANLAARARRPGSSDAATSSVLPVVAAGAAQRRLVDQARLARLPRRRPPARRSRTTHASASARRIVGQRGAGRPVVGRRRRSRAQAIAAARSQLGVPYVWGGTTPTASTAPASRSGRSSRPASSCPAPRARAGDEGQAGRRRQHAARRPDLLQQPGQPRRHLHRRRQDDRGPEQRHRRQDRDRLSGAGRPERPSAASPEGDAPTRGRGARARRPERRARTMRCAEAPQLPLTWSR